MKDKLLMIRKYDEIDNENCPANQTIAQKRHRCNDMTYFTKDMTGRDLALKH